MICLTCTGFATVTTLLRLENTVSYVFDEVCSFVLTNTCE